MARDVTAEPEIIVEHRRGLRFALRTGIDFALRYGLLALIASISSIPLLWMCDIAETARRRVSIPSGADSGPTSLGKLHRRVARSPHSHILGE